MRVPHTDVAAQFWLIRGLPRWEQMAFTGLNVPFAVVTVLLQWVLFIPFQICLVLVLPMFVLSMCATTVWYVCFAWLLLLSMITERLTFLRPVSFVLAIPVMILADNLTGLMPTPQPIDKEARLYKWDIIMAFPFSWSFVRFTRRMSF